jgi:hypothetical protein
MYLSVQCVQEEAQPMEKKTDINNVAKFLFVKLFFVAVT